MNEIDEIRQEMARIRHDMHDDVTGVVDSASDAMDWRYYFRSHPWISSGAALLIGYYLVPKRSRSVEIVKVPTPIPYQAMSTRPTIGDPAAEPPKRSALSPWRIMGWALSFAGPLALNAAQAYASVWIENQLGIRPKGPNGPEADGPRDRGSRPTKEGRAGATASPFGSGRGFPG